jgi:cytosine permease
MQESRFSVPDTFFFLNLHGRYPVIPDVPAAPAAAFIVGFAVYFACAKIGLIAPVISMPNRADVS